MSSASGSLQASSTSTCVCARRGVVRWGVGGVPTIAGRQIAGVWWCRGMGERDARSLPQAAQEELGCRAVRPVEQSKTPSRGGRAFRGSSSGRRPVCQGVSAGQRCAAGRSGGVRGRSGGYGAHGRGRRVGWAAVALSSKINRLQLSRRYSERGAGLLTSVGPHIFWCSSLRCITSRFRWSPFFPMCGVPHNVAGYGEKCSPGSTSRSYRRPPGASSLPLAMMCTPVLEVRPPYTSSARR